jgi:NAD(P)H-hydrate epimerase
MTIPVHTGDIPYLTTSQMIEVDRAMMEDFRIDLIRMMENAGRTLAHLARVRFLGGRSSHRFPPTSWTFSGG